LLIGANASLLLVFVTHAGLDATRDWSGSIGLPIQVWVVGALLVANVALALVLALRGDPRAPAAAILAGFSTSAAALLFHAGPAWGPFSRSSYWAVSAHADALSVALLSGVCMIGLSVGVAGLITRSANAGRLGGAVPPPPCPAGNGA
jgi:hypothetical protein